MSKKHHIGRTPRESEVREFVLRQPGLGAAHLDGYVFSNEEHARTWMSQPMVRESPNKYRLVTAFVTRAACCGAVVALRDEQPVDLGSEP
jgi:hypothetical protein